MTKKQHKLTAKQSVSIVIAVLTLLANVAVILLIGLSFQYAGIEGKTIYSIYGIAVCLLIIMDIIFFVAYNHRDQKLKIVTGIMTVLLLLGGSVGVYYISRVNKAVGNITNEENGDRYETIRVVYATYDNPLITEVSDLNNKTVGSLGTDGVSAASVGRDYLEEENIKPNYKSYNMTSELYQALIEGEIDAAIFPNTYRSQLKSEEGFEDYLDKTVDIYSFEKEVVTGQSEALNIDISVEAFNILLIGYAPEPGGGGLTDTIIVASVNPQTMTATMVSIPRDSYVPISCYNNARSKINDAGAASRSCLMETVGNLLQIDVDFYMEVNFQGLVDIVDALGGVLINSPVEFVGQTPSSDRGDYTVWVPAGEYLANGEQALAFARERHAMPNGDFDRQIHQQQVISEIVRKMMDLTDINQALAVMDAAGDNFTTNLSVKQLTSIFNYLLTAPNYTGMPQFSLLNILSSRVTGYTRWFYSYSMRLPLWSYYLWDGSIKDNVALLDETLGEFDNVQQDTLFNFFVEYPYDRGLLYHEYYNEPMIPEDMPPYYPHLAGMTYSEAMAWASANGVVLEVKSINEGEPGYDPDSVGLVVDQYPRYGALVEEYPTGSITVIGTPLSDEDRVPNFVGRDYSEVFDWANNNGYGVDAQMIDNLNGDDSLVGKVTEQSIPSGSDKNQFDSITISYYGPTVDNSTLVGMNRSQIESWCAANSGGCTYVLVEGEVDDIVTDFDCSNRLARRSSTYTIYITKHCEGGKTLNGGVCTCPDGTIENEGGTCEVPSTPPSESETTSPSESGDPPDNSSEPSGSGGPD